MPLSRRRLLAAGAALAAASRVSFAAAMKRVGVIGVDEGGTYNRWKDEFPKAFSDLGWVEGKNLELAWFDVPWRGPQGEHSGRELMELGRKRAAERAAARLDCMVANGEPHARMLHEVSRTVPIVVVVPDPIASGFVTNLARPGGNMTGLHNGDEVTALKAAELLRRLVPATGCIAWIGSENFRPSAVHLENAARSLGLRFRAVTVKGWDPASLAAMRREMALLRGEGCVTAHGLPMTEEMTEAMTRSALEHRLAMAGMPRQDGFLLAYSARRQGADDSTRRVVAIVARVLRGEKPAEIPFEGPARYYLMVNLRTAARLGITVPADVLVVADEVVR